MFTNDEPQVEAPEDQKPVEPEVPAAEPEKELEVPQEPAINPETHDEYGVPWKNRAREYERKYFSSLEKRAEAPKEIDPIEEETDPRRIAEHVVDERTRHERQAEQQFNEIFSEMSAVRPELAGLKAEVEKELSQVPANRRDERLIRAVTLMKYGEMSFKKKAEQPVQKKIVRQGSDVIVPGAKAGQGIELTLTDAEREYADHHRFIEKGFSNEEIKDLYKRGKK